MLITASLLLYFDRCAHDHFFCLIKKNMNLNQETVLEMRFSSSGVRACTDLSESLCMILDQNLAWSPRFSGNLVPRFPMNLLSFKKLCGVLLGGFINVFPLWYFERYVHDFSFLKLNCKVFYLMCSFLFISIDIVKGVFMIYLFFYHIGMCANLCAHYCFSPLILWFGFSKSILKISNIKQQN